MNKTRIWSEIGAVFAMLVMASLVTVLMCLWVAPSANETGEEALPPIALPSGGGEETRETENGGGEEIPKPPFTMENSLII